MKLKEKLKDILKDESVKERLDSIESRLSELEDSIAIYEELEGEEGDVRITREIYNKMCEYLDEDEIELMGLR